MAHLPPPTSISSLTSTAAEVRDDLTPGPYDVPPFSLGGPEGYTVAPDSLELAFVMNVDPVPAASTNSDIYTVPLDGGIPAKSPSDPAPTTAPSTPPTENFLAFRSQPRAGYAAAAGGSWSSTAPPARATNLTESLDLAG